MQVWVPLWCESKTPPQPPTQVKDLNLPCYPALVSDSQVGKYFDPNFIRKQLQILDAWVHCLLVLLAFIPWHYDCLVVGSIIDY